MRASWLLGAVVGGVVGVHGVQAQPAPSLPPGLERLLTGELSPGLVALLVNHVSRPEALTRLAGALTHARPDVRAAAARVAFVVGARGLLPTMARVLESETDADPAAEMTRALATFGDPTRDEALIAVWTRLGRGTAARPAIAYAAARGPATLNALSALRDVDDSDPTIEASVRAARPEPSQVLGLVERALDASDPVTFHAALDLAGRRHLEVADTVLIRALEPARAPEIRAEAARHAFSRRGESALAPTLISALLAEAPFSLDGADPEGQALREFAGRAAGRPPTTAPGWLSQFDDPDGTVADLVTSPRIRALLTDRERRQLSRALPSFSQGPRPVVPPGAPPTADAAVHLLGPYPHGFMPDLLATVGCDVKKAQSAGLGAGAAELTLYPDGRVARVSLINTSVSQTACANALRVLFMTHVTRSRPDFGERWTAVAPLDQDYIACRESQAHDAFGRTVRGRGRVTAPKKTRHVNPTYPDTALRAGVQGTVLLEATIGTNGCVGDLQVTSSVDPRLDLAALMSVLQWRFTPTTRAAVAVPVTMTVAVRFTLR